MFGMMIETGPKFYMVLFPTSTWPVGEGQRLRILYKSFVIIF